MKGPRGKVWKSFDHGQREEEEGMGKVREVGKPRNVSGRSTGEEYWPG